MPTILEAQAWESDQPQPWREAVMFSVRLYLPLLLQWPGCQVFLPHLNSATWFLQTPSPPPPPPLEPLWESRLGFLAAAFPSLPHCSSLASLVCSTRTWRRHSSPSPVIVTNWNGKQERLQKKSLLWAALLEENESPKQIGFCDLRQTSLFILHNPV